MATYEAAGTQETCARQAGTRRRESRIRSAIATAGSVLVVLAALPLLFTAALVGAAAAPAVDEWEQEEDGGGFGCS